MTEDGSRPTSAALDRSVLRTLATGTVVGASIGSLWAWFGMRSVSQLLVEPQVLFVVLNVLSWGTVGALGALLAHLLRRSAWPGWGAVVLFVALELGVGWLGLGDGARLVALLATALVLFAVLERLGRVASFLEWLPVWGALLVGTVVGSELAILDSAEAPPDARAAVLQMWPIAVGLAVGLAALVAPLLKRPSAVAVALLAAFVVAGVLPGGLRALSPTPERAPATAPNVLVVTIDTLRADALGCYGNERARTPRLDALAAEGVLFEDAQSPIPLTDPSHTSILSGLYPGSHGVKTNMPWPVRDGVVTLPETFAREGYRTAAFISGFTLRREASRLNARFETYDDTLGSFRVVPDVWTESTLAQLIKDASDLVGRRIRGLRPGSDRPADQTVTSAIEWIDRTDAPFFLWVHMFDPHLPYEPPTDVLREHLDVAGLDGDAGLGRRWYRMTPEERKRVVTSEKDMERLHALYRAEVTHADREVGRLLDHLESAGLADDTLVVVTSDHGESIGEHDYYFDHGRYLYDTCLSVPLITRLPEAFASNHPNASGLRVGDQVRLVDIAPTVRDLFGLEGPDDLDGRTLVPLLGGEEKRDDAAFAVAYDLRPEKGRYLLAVRTGSLKYVRTADGWEDLRLHASSEELYDLDADPGETRNVADVRPDDLRKMRELADRYWRDWRIDDASKAGTVGEGVRERLGAIGYF